MFRWLSRCVLLSVIVTPALAQGPVTASHALEAERTAALQAYDAGRADDALSRLRLLSARLPHDFAVQEALGLLLAEAGKLQDALPHLKAAVTAHPQDPAAHVNFGAALFQLGRAHDAVPELAAAVRLDPKNADDHAALGRALFLDHQPDAAAKALAIAYEAYPQDADLRYDLALALYNSHQDAASLQLMEATPPGQRTSALEALWGDVAEHAGKYQFAVEHLQQAAKLDPSEQNLYALTVEFLRHWTWQAAIEIADYGLGRYPDSQRLRFAKGVALYGNTQFAAAADLFGPMLQAHPENAAYADLLGRSCAALGGAGSSNCAVLPVFASQHRGNARASLFAAISLLHGQDSEQHLDEAESLLKNSVAVDPKDSEAWYQMGVLQQQRGDWAQSATSLQKAIALRPAYAEAHYRLSRAYAHQGQKQMALDELERQKQFAAQEKQASDAQLKEVTIFLTDAR